MDTIPEEGHERVLGRDQVDCFKLCVQSGSLFKADYIVDQGVDGEHLSSYSGHGHAVEFLRPHHKGRVRPSDKQHFERD